MITLIMNPWKCLLGASISSNQSVNGTIIQVTMCEIWHNMAVGMKVEVENKDCDLPNAYWIATVMKIAGNYFRLKKTQWGI